MKLYKDSVPIMDLPPDANRWEILEQQIHSLPKLDRLWKYRITKDGAFPMREGWPTFEIR